METRITLSDGRQLGYSAFGDPDGDPIINCHGGLVSRLDVAPADGAARELGVRIISPDRPGIGLSSPKPGRNTLDWASDVRELADQLGLARFSMLGWSMGGQYALACAHAWPDRVASTAVIAGCLPLTDAHRLGQLNRMDRRFTEMADKRPRQAEIAFKSLGEILRHAPDLYNEMSARGLSAPDLQAVHELPDPGLAGMAAPALATGAGMVEEYRAWARPWGFALASIRTPVTIWHGDADSLVPSAWAEEMARQIPGAQLQLLTGEGHLLAYRHYPEILGDLVSRCRAA